jgi:hypothetical protein
LTHDNLGLRVEWLKQRARAQQWREEVLLVEEEMRRSLSFCLWRSKWWFCRASGHTDKPAHVVEGLVAYSTEQKDAEEQRAMLWAAKWAAIRERAKAVLRGHLANDNNTDFLPELLVVLNDEDDRVVEEEVEDA